MPRLKATVALLLTAFFAVAGAFHHHAPLAAIHDHAGACASATSIGLESCAICKLAHTTVHLAGQPSAPLKIVTASRLAVAPRYAPTSACCSLLRDSRAPPASDL
jgi:hypothetical protein